MTLPRRAVQRCRRIAVPVASVWIRAVFKEKSCDRNLQLLYCQEQSGSEVTGILLHE